MHVLTCIYVNFGFTAMLFLCWFDRPNMNSDNAWNEVTPAQHDEESPLELLPKRSTNGETITDPLFQGAFLLTEFIWD